MTTGLPLRAEILSLRGYRRAPGADGPGTHASLESGVHAAVALPTGDAAIPFAIDLPVKGSAGAYWVPLGKVTEVAVHSNWASPSFQGNWLPERREVGPRGFDAEWRVSWLGRNFPQAWTDTHRCPPRTS